MKIIKTIYNDDDGWWAEFNPGWQFDDCHGWREDTKAKLLEVVKMAKHCHCPDCTPSPTMSEARRMALAALHGARKGVRIAEPDPRRESTLAALAAALANPQRKVRSARACAKALGVDKRTLARWLAGVDWPTPESVDAIQRWLATLQPVAITPVAVAGV